MHELEQLFKNCIGEPLQSCTPLSAAGSNRRYFRLTGEKTVLIGVQGESADENHAFVAIAKHLYIKGINVPKVVAVSDGFLCYLQEDLGDVSLFDFIAQGRKSGNFSENEIEILKKTISKLPEIQIKGAENFDFSVCYPQADFNRRSVMWDLNYFKYCFLKMQNIDFQENMLENDFETFAEILLQEPTETFMYRDFQSRNVMLKNGEPYFIDFQGSSRGALQYDVASFLWQAKANFSEKLRNELLNCYLDELKKIISVDENHFKNSLKYFVLFRILQTLGAYGYRGYFERKTHFIESIPKALANIDSLLQNTDFKDISYLTKILLQISPMSFPLHSITPNAECSQRHNILKISIFSFSYKKGIPIDESGNGGGFVFDCRAVHNPGKYEQYKNLTGLDKPVKDFLERGGEILTFLQHAYALADAAVSRYIERGFTHLQICFGCTGGQHRSVYSAQAMAEHLAEKFNVEIELTHRELS